MSFSEAWAHFLRADLVASREQVDLKQGWPLSHVHRYLCLLLVGKAA